MEEQEQLLIEIEELVKEISEQIANLQENLEELLGYGEEEEEDETEAILTEIFENCMFDDEWIEFDPDVGIDDCDEDQDNE